MDMTGADERRKYEKAWSFDKYRQNSPGERNVRAYLDECQPTKGRLIDFGTGPGRAALMLHEQGFDVTMVDIAGNCLDAAVAEKIGDKLVVANLWDDLDLPHADEGYCVDVLEHIPPEHVEAVIDNMLRLCDRVHIQVCLIDDIFGDHIGEDLHLTVRPYAWWRALLASKATLLDARDLIYFGWFYVDAHGARKVQ